MKSALKYRLLEWPSESHNCSVVVRSAKTPSLRVDWSAKTPCLRPAPNFSLTELLRTFEFYLVAIASIPDLQFLRVKTSLTKRILSYLFLSYDVFPSIRSFFVASRENDGKLKWEV